MSDRVRRGPPAGFGTASIMDFVFAGFGIAGGGYVAHRSGNILEALQINPELIREDVDVDLLFTQLEALVRMGWVFVLAGVVALLMGIGVRQGTSEVRVGQIVVSVGLIGVCAWALAESWIGVTTLLGLASQVAALFVMVQAKPAAPEAAGSGSR